MFTRIFVTGFLVAAFSGCASSPSSGAHASANGSERKAHALKTPDDQVPAPVRAIEARIDRRSALIADEVEIHCSKNYEWDVSLSGDVVTPQRPDGTELVSEAEGHPHAVFRALEIRAHKRIVFRRSGLGVVPFIRVTARGSAAYADETAGGEGVRRARTIRIENAEIRFQDETPDQGQPASFDARADLPLSLRGN